MQRTLLIAVIVPLLTGFSPKKEKESLKDPNIIFILADDMGYGDVSVFNEHSKIKTPFIDKLANEGVMFTDAYTSSSVCTPTRYGILTGRYNWRSRLKSGVLSGYSKSLIKPERTTIAEFLKDYGYKTAFIGKWHLGWNWHIPGKKDENLDRLNASPEVDFSKPVKNGPRAHGFDYSYGFCGSLDMPPYVWVENVMPTMVPTKTTVNRGKQTRWRKGLTADDFDHDQVLPDITKKSVSFIQEHAEGEKPFFLYFPLPAPHTPILPTERFQGKSGLDNPYGDFVIMVDWVVGQIMKALDETEISENTLVIFTADNGCSPAADYKQLATKGHNPSYFFRGHKADIYEGGLHVPFIARWPGKVKPAVSDQLVCTTDLFSTFADILDTTCEDNFAEDSYSFLPALGLESNAKTREDVVLHSINGSFALLKENWKTIFCPGSGGWSDPRPVSEEIEKLPDVQLYNLEEDMAEENNLQEAFPGKVEDARQLLKKYVTQGRSTPGTPQKNDGPETWSQLPWIQDKP